MDFDPGKISYQQLLDVFWAAHHPTSPPWSRQYRSAIFPGDPEQERLARESLDREQKRLGRRVYTTIEPAGAFHRAEDYHQKYYLQQESAVAAEYRAIFPDFRTFVDSTAVARANGYLGGHGEAGNVRATLSLLGLSAKGQQALIREARPPRCGF